uniref:MIP18 family-like domain-containing protein n=1 Tax=Parascaris equorum TaxID=6256 RepID=A0A914R8D6_PAREQ
LYFSDINDPEHPLTLEQLNVVQEELISIDDEDDETIVDVRFTPTIPHCSMATLIGLAIRIKLMRSLHPSIRFILSQQNEKTCKYACITNSLYIKINIGFVDILLLRRKFTLLARASFQVLTIEKDKSAFYMTSEITTPEM